MARTLIDLDVQSKDLSLTTAKLANSAVTNIKVSASAEIDISKLNTTAADWDDSGLLKVGVVDSAELAADSVTALKLNADTAGAGLTQDGAGALQVNPDGVTLEINADAVRIRADGITNTHINSAAGILFSKMEALAQNAIVVGSAATVPTAIDTDGVGDITASSTGGLTYKAGSIDNADINVAAGIVTSKLADSANFLLRNASNTLTNAVRYTYGVTQTFTNDGDLVSKEYVDSLVQGRSWKEPVSVLHLVGNNTVANLDAGSPTKGDAYVISTGGTFSTLGSITVAVGDIVEFDGAAYVKIITNSGGFVPLGTRAVLATQTNLAAPYSDGVDDGKIVDFSGASNTGADTGDTADGSAVLVQSTEAAGVWDNIQFTFQGSVPTGTWIQTSGTGQITAGAGLTKTATSIDVGDAGKGVQVNANDLEFSAGEAVHATGGLEASANSWQLKIKPDATTGGTSANVVKLSANGVAIGIDNSTIQVVGGNLEVVEANLSGVDAATLDGVDSLQFMRSDVGDTWGTAAGATLVLGSHATDTVNLAKVWQIGGSTVNATAANLNVLYNTTVTTAELDALGTIVVRETPNEAPNGVITQFTVDNTPIAGSEEVFLNGLLQDAAGEDYSISGVTITFVSAPKTGDKIRVSYRY